ncbi:MAG: 2-amino-4-hydroxy-6-hydroxymethyldihydropteridine diphosphokinase [Bacteroidia bacterium]|nr:2-amino-4-hydroxy-6-hydroxymethyldihydropteridine diphosphokinase [Bacteroidia bacterium]
MDNGVFLLLGSNLGNREENLLYALNSIQHIGMVVASSAIYQTKAWGNTLQPDFLNQVVQIAYDKSPHQLLLEIHTLENEMGRLRSEKWGPRIIDIDILFFGQRIINEENLIIPHSGIAMRRFTLLPLSEIAPEFIHPVLNKNCNQLLKECPDTSYVELYQK